jgi:hypothetical protein
MLSIDYSCELASQAQFEQFHQLFVQIRRFYFNHTPDDNELHQLVVAFINSPFWESYRSVVVEEMADNFWVDQLLLRHLARMANYYRKSKQRFSVDKIILQQSLATLVDFGQSDLFPYNGSLVPLLLIHIMRNRSFDITQFETEVEQHEPQQDRSSIRRDVEHRLRYLAHEQRFGRIITEREYRVLVNEVVELISTGALPPSIEPLQQQSRGSLLSGYSCEYVTYGISLLSYRYGLHRDLSIEYLSHKLRRSNSTLQKKFTRKPDSWDERIIVE